LSDSGATLTDVIARSSHARGGGLANFGTLSKSEGAIRCKSARHGSGLESARRATLTCGRSPASGADELSFPYSHVRTYHEISRSEF
jgi:hypothetical protein